MKPTVKFFIYFGSDDAINYDTGMGRRAREAQVYYDTAAEARRAIRQNGWQEVATVETSESQS